MSPDTDHGADSAGVPWAGRRFQPNPAAGDDGSADPTLWAALAQFRAGTASQAEVVDALRGARVLVPLVAEKGEEGVNAQGLTVDKTQELSIVTVAAPDGRTVLPLFTCVQTLATWDSQARPIPVAGPRAALAAAGEDTDLIVIDPASDTEFIVRRPAVWAIAQEQPWEPAPQNPDVYLALQQSVATEMTVVDVAVEPGDREARLRGPELIVHLQLVDGLNDTELNAVLARLAKRWAADDRIAVLVDSLSVKLHRAP